MANCTDSTQDVEYWLGVLRQRKWLMYFPGAPGDTREVSAVLTWPDVYDVVVLISESHALAYRAPRGNDNDPFAPEFVLDSYAGPAVWTLRWLLTQEPPGKQLSPLRPVPADFTIPYRGPVTIRPARSTP
ncbi:hypothetical protein Acsp05_29090 [Actinokineospora sp. NBRC 105648]|nr:hypothetical protein Acsp05_29090 [Actinokineospora sp. NBRC 105648]